MINGFPNQKPFFTVKLCDILTFNIDINSKMTF